MGESKRAQRRRKKSQAKRAEAIARAPAMLADEQDLTESLDVLLRRSRDMTTHIDLDAQIRVVIDRNAEVSGALMRALTKFQELLGQIWMKRFIEHADADALRACQDARSELANAENLSSELSALTQQATELLKKRAALGVVPVDNEQLVKGIDQMHAHLHTIKSAVAQHQQVLEGHCSGENVS